MCSDRLRGLDAQRRTELRQRVSAAFIRLASEQYGGIWFELPDKPKQHGPPVPRQRNAWTARERHDSLLFRVLPTTNVREWEPTGAASSRRGGGLRPEECAFVDDNEPNVVAARELGMSAVHFRDTEQARTELEAVLTDGSPA